MLLPLAGVTICHQQQLPQRQHLDVAEDRQPFVIRLTDALDVAAATQDPEFSPQDVVIGGGHGAAQQVLDYFEALVHRLLISG